MDVENKNKPAAASQVPRGEGYGLAPHHPQLTGGGSAASPWDAFRARAASLGYASIDLDGMTVPPAVLQLVPEDVARDERLMPVAVDGETLTVAMSDPPAPETLERLRFALNHPLSVALAPPDAVLGAIERHYRALHPGAEPPPPGAAAPAEIDFVEIDQADQAAWQTMDIPDPDSPPVVRTVQALIGEAFHLGASRVLILPVKQRVKVAFRIQDGVYTREDLAPQLLYPLLVRLMTMANFGGVIKVILPEKREERRLRVRFKPTRHGLSAAIDVAADPALLERVRARAARLGYEFLALEERVIADTVLAMVPERVARENRILPVAHDGSTLTVAMSDPRAADMLDKLRFILNRPVAAVMAPEGAILAAIQRYYGPPDPETADLVLWELAQAEQAEAAAGNPRAERTIEPDHPARAVLDHLGALGRGPLFELFDDLRVRPRLCQRDAASGNLEVLFPQSHLMSLMPPAARRYLEDKIWGLREAILARLELFLDKDPAARGLAMAYSQYLAACRLAEGEAASINPATELESWVNFVYCFTVKSFPALDSNGTLLSLVTDHVDQLAQRIAAVLDDQAMVVDPQGSRPWLARLEKQTTIDDAVDYDSPAVVGLVDLLLADAVHCRASQILVLPWEDRVEVALRVQKAVYRRDDLPLALLYPVLARLVAMGDGAGQFVAKVGRRERSVRVVLQPSPHGLSALVHLRPDEAAVQRAKEQAASLGFRFARLSEVDVLAAVLELVPRRIARRMLILPLAVQVPPGQPGTVTVAMSEPPSSRRLNELRLLFNHPLSVLMAPEDDLVAAIYRHYHAPGSPAASAAAVSLLQHSG